MVFEDWKVAVQTQLSTPIPDVSDFEGVARQVIALNILMAEEAPHNIKTTYDGISEVKLNELRDQWITRIHEKAASPKLDFNAPKGLVAELGGLCRAWDEILLVEANSKKFARSSDDWLVDGWYVIPRKTVPHWRQPKLKDGFNRRGFLKHRLFRSVIEGLHVEPVFLETMAINSAKPPSGFGAAYFSNLAITLDSDTEETFFVAKIEEDGLQTVVEHQLHSSSATHCFNIVWPELTMPESLRNHVVGMLKKNGGRETPLNFPDIVVAGSWHEGAGNDRKNIARVYNGFGREKVVHEKVVAYVDDKLGTEAIATGDRLPILVTDDYVVAFAICKDFCGASTSSNPYLALNVDCVLVPSMGDDKAANAHQSVAELMRNATGGRAFVVQQAYVPKDGVFAYVIPPDTRAGDNPIELKNDENWCCFNGL